MEKAVREITAVGFGFGSVEAKDGPLRFTLTSSSVLSGRVKTTPLSLAALRIVDGMNIELNFVFFLFGEIYGVT